MDQKVYNSKYLVHITPTSKISDSRNAIQRNQNQNEIRFKIAPLISEKIVNEPNHNTEHQHKLKT